MTIVVVSAGTSLPSSTHLLGERLGEAVADAWPGAEPVEVRHLELRLLASDLANFVVTRVPSPALEDAFAAVGSATGVIAVTPVWNASYSGLFKLFFDALDEGVMRGRPVLLAATGGTPRHSLALDQALVPLFFYLRALVSPTAVFAATDDWGADANLDERIRRAGAEFAELAHLRPGLEIKDEIGDISGFADLLGASARVG